MTYDIPTLTSEAVGLLKSLISIPSVSRDEARAADCLQQYIEQQGMQTGRKGNNVWCLGPGFDLKRPTLLLNSHIDTVKPVQGWRKDPFTPRLEPNGKLYGLGSNDAGASVVSLLQAFLTLCRTTQNTISFIWLRAKKKCPAAKASKASCPSCRLSASPLWVSLRKCSLPSPRRG